MSFAAKTIIKSRQIGDVRYLTDAQLEQAHARSGGAGVLHAGLPTAGELELRRQLCLFLRRGCRQRLLISTEGSFSARLGDDSFLITPTQQDRESLDVADFVLIQGQRREAGRRPAARCLPIRPSTANTRTCTAIVFAHPVNATAFQRDRRELRLPHHP